MCRAVQIEIVEEECRRVYYDQRLQHPVITIALRLRQLQQEQNIFFTEKRQL